MGEKDYYQILGVSRDASKEDIDRAFRNLAKKYHPDMNKDNREWAEEKFKEISEAYEVLGDPEKRKRYDQVGYEGIRRGFSGGEFTWEDFSHFDIFNDLFGDSIFNIFSSFAGGPGWGRRSNMVHSRGDDIKMMVEVELDDIVDDVRKTINVPYKKRCSHCGGTGADSESSLKTCPQCGGAGQVKTTRNAGFFQFARIETCPRCHGKGRIIETPCSVCGGSGLEDAKRKMEITIPAGVEDGTRLRLSGKGNESPSGGASGDMYIIVHIKEHEYFERDGPDLLLDVPISYPQAILGDEIDIPSLRGKVRFNIPPGTEPGTVFRLQGLGLPTPIYKKDKGDLYVRISVETPKKLDAETKKLVKQLAKKTGVKWGQPLKAFKFKSNKYEEESILKKGRDFFEKIKYRHRN